MNLATYRGLLSSHNRGMVVCFKTAAHWALSPDLIHRLSLDDGDTLVVHEMPPRGLQEWDWIHASRFLDGPYDYHEAEKILDSGGTLYGLSVNAKELGNQIGYFKWLGINPESLYAFEVIKMKSQGSKMGPTERSLRRSCDVQDTVGFGELRGILTGDIDQSRPKLAELAELEPMLDGTFMKDRLVQLEERFVYLFREWDMMNDQLCDPTLDCDSANMIMVRYLKVAAELEKCLVEKESGQRMMERWEKVIDEIMKNTKSNNSGKLFTWDSISVLPGTIEKKLGGFPE